MMNSTFSTADFEQMQRFFLSGATKSYAFRKEQLKTLRIAIQQYEQQLTEALFRDLHKSPEEAYATEIGFVYAELSHAEKYLQNWIEPQRVSSPLFLFPSSSKVVREPLGVTLIISPWNYPFHLLFAPLIGAIAGGNCAILKPSELAVHTSAVIVEMIPAFFDSKFIRVTEGAGATVVPEMMNKNRFDHVFFTGSLAVGREIAQLAAQKLVPVTLEMGGKSPCIVDRDVDVKVAARRITWGKFSNTGQTCVAPDYLLVHEDRKDELLEKIEASIELFYGNNPQQSASYGRIINEQRFDRLQSFLQQGKIVTGGQTKREDLYIAPTVMEDVGLSQPIMQEEIFGPILPVLTYKNSDEALNIIQTNPNPLSLYVFSSNKKTEQLYFEKVNFGGGCINNTLVHLGNPELPFGGVGNSGVGTYHGKFSFDAFTRPKAYLKTATWIDPALIYPPYKGKMKIFKWFLR